MSSSLARSESTDRQTDTQASKQASKQRAVNWWCLARRAVLYIPGRLAPTASPPATAAIVSAAAKATSEESEMGEKEGRNGEEVRGTNDK